MLARRGSGAGAGGRGRRLVAAVALGLVVGVPAQRAVAEGEARVEVRRRDVAEPGRPHLVFLKENRVFLRAEMDRLRQLDRTTHDGDAALLDARLLRLRELAAAVAAARDTVGDTARLVAARTRLETVQAVTDLEAELELMESLLAAQNQRLAWLEADYLEQQHTALVIVVGGFGGRAAPDSLRLSDGEETWRVGFTAEQRLALGQGGLAQVYHAYVEPRWHEFTLTLSGGDWAAAPPATISVDTPRDRLTFLEIDLAGADPRAGTGAPSVVAWQR